MYTDSGFASVHVSLHPLRFPSSSQRFVPSSRFSSSATQNEKKTLKKVCPRSTSAWSSSNKPSQISPPPHKPPVSRVSLPPLPSPPSPEVPLPFQSLNRRPYLRTSSSCCQPCRHLTNRHLHRRPSYFCPRNRRSATFVNAVIATASLAAFVTVFALSNSVLAATAHTYRLRTPVAPAFVSRRRTAIAARSHRTHQSRIE